MSGTIETLLLIGFISIFTSGVVLSQLWAYDTTLILVFITDLVTSHALVLLLVLLGTVTVFYTDLQNERADDSRRRL